MNMNAELLNFIYQNSQMGVDTISQLIEISEDEKFKDYLNVQLKGYRDIHSDAKEALNENGFDEKGISAVEKIRTYIMINMKTITDKTSSNIAEMLIIGSNMGVIDAIKNLKKYNRAEKDIQKLMEKLLKFEESNIQDLKAFL